MANTSISLVDLDFVQVKQNLKNYLRGQDRFKDYDFEGSNMSVLLDVLAYNTFQNAFYLNMIGSEMFLDSAQFDESIVSHAKELNYLPRSFSSSRAVIDLTVTPIDSNTQIVSIPKGTPFFTKVGGNNFSFVTDTTIVLSNGVNGVFTANNLEIFEGSYTTESYTYNRTANNDFKINNINADISSLTVVTSSDGGSNTKTWSRKDTLIDVDANTYAYFIQAAGVNQYEILFGDGTFGREPDYGSVVTFEYRTSSGELSNSARNFSIGSAIDGHSNVSINLVSSAIGGRVNETIDQIRFFAPRQYQTQERAVTANDYEILLKREFPEINAIAAYGGELADPPQYGKVFIAIDLSNADGIPEYKKEQFYDWIAPRSPITIEPIFLDPDFTFLYVDASINYNLNVTTLTASDISARVLGTIQDYNTVNLNGFKKAIRSSALQKNIDNTHESIVSSELNIEPYKRFKPQLNSDTDLLFSFEAALRNDIPAIATVHAGEQLHCISSTPFTFSGRKCEIEDDGDGNIRIVTLEGGIHTALTTIGTVDYDTGSVAINGLNITNYDGNFLKIYAKTRRKDYQVSKNVILEIKGEDINVVASGIRV